MQISKKDYKKAKNTLLWRYMSLPKFLDLILNGRLYFADLGTLSKEDPYESAFPLYADYPVYIKKIMDECKQNTNKDPQAAAILDDAFPDCQEFEKISNNFRIIKSSTFANCWHSNKDENYAMWKIYANNDASVAIVTDIEMLQNAITSDKEISAGFVKYNYGKFLSQKRIQGLNSFKNFNMLKKYLKKASFYKRGCFEYEKEFRLIYQADFVDENKNYVSVDINKLIKYIYISPSAEDFIKNIIKTTLNELKNCNKLQLEIEKIVVESSIKGNLLNDYLGSLARYCLENNNNISNESEKYQLLLLLIISSSNCWHKLLNNNE